MKKISKYTLLLAGLLSFASCSEDDLTPSNSEVDRMAELLDMNNPIVKDLKENYDINLLTEFNDTLDFKFGFFTSTANTRWEKVAITHLPVEEQEYAINQYNEDVLQYLNEDFRKMMPKKIVLSQKTNISECNGNPDKTMSSVDDPESGYVTVIANQYSYMCSYNKEGMEEASEKTLAVLKAHKMYHMLATVMSRKHLYDKIPQSFRDPVKDYYGMGVDSMAQMEPELPVIPPLRPTMKPMYYKPEWYIGKGFVITKKSPNTKNYTTNYERILRINNDYCLVPYFNEDAKNFLHMAVYGTDERNYPKYYLKSPIFCERMRIFIQFLQDIGFDVLKFNPALENLLK